MKSRQPEFVYDVEYTEYLRAYFAGQAMQGFCSNPNVFAANSQHGWDLVNCTSEQLGLYATEIADDLIAALNTENK